MNRRRGASLVELMVVISIIGVVFGIVGTVFQRLFQSEQLSVRAALLEQTTSRLADRYRRDVHAARSVRRSVSQDEGLPSLELISEADDSAKVVYTVGENKVRRDGIALDGTATHETYRLPDCRISFPEPEGESPADLPRPRQLTTLRIERPHSTSSAVRQAPRPLHALNVIAELGRDLRLGLGLVPHNAAPIGENQQ